MRATATTLPMSSYNVVSPFAISLGRREGGKTKAADPSLPARSLSRLPLRDLFQFPLILQRREGSSIAIFKSRSSPRRRNDSPASFVSKCDSFQRSDGSLAQDRSCLSSSPFLLSIIEHSICLGSQSSTFESSGFSSLRFRKRLFPPFLLLSPISPISSSRNHHGSFLLHYSLTPLFDSRRKEIRIGRRRHFCPPRRR